MGCKHSKVEATTTPAVRRSGSKREQHYVDDDSTVDDAIIAPDNASLDKALLAQLLDTKRTNSIQLADPQAFNSSLVQQRQQAIDNRSYRSTVDSWQPNSLEELADTLKALSKGKATVDRYWLIFYWVAINIEYDTVSYFSKNYADQTAEGVFRTRKGVCAGYANIYKYLCDALQMPCEVVGGYSKGYGFDDREGAPTETDHAWNVVQIHSHWYLVESTWAAGHLNDEKRFVRELNAYYFLARADEMIYHHLPEDEKWQLLQTPVKMQQYMQMPKLRPVYFQLNLELINPCNQAHVDLLPQKSYAVVLIRAPANVRLMASLQLDDQKVEGGERVLFNKQEQIYCCLFAPAAAGRHKATIFGKREDTGSDTYSSALELPLDIKKMPANPVSFPKTWSSFFDLGLEVLSPRNTHLINLAKGVTHTQILIKTLDDVELLGQLKNEKGEKIENGHRVYYDERQHLWRCSFAPNANGRFEVIIMAKKKSDSGNYSSAVGFKIDARQMPSPNISYPNTWQLFYDLNLKIEAPIGSANAVWADGASYAEVLIKAPDDVQLSCKTQYNDVTVENGSLAQYNREKNLWQLLFAPERTGRHELLVFGKRNSAKKSSARTVVKFNLDVTKLRRPMKFPVLYTQFHTEKCQIYTPLESTLKKGAVVPLHCLIPGATDVNVTVDSEWLKAEGYTDPILRRQVTVGAKELVIYAKYGQKPSYDGLVKYTVQ